MISNHSDGKQETLILLHRSFIGEFFVSFSLYCNFMLVVLIFFPRNCLSIWFCNLLQIDSTLVLLFYSNFVHSKKKNNNFHIYATLPNPPKRQNVFTYFDCVWKIKKIIRFSYQALKMEAFTRNLHTKSTMHNIAEFVFLWKEKKNFWFRSKAYDYWYFHKKKFVNSF